MATTVTQNKLSIRTDYDKLADLMGLRRLPTDSNVDLKAKLINLWKFLENTSRQGMINSISSALGEDQYNVKTRRMFLLTQQPKTNSTFDVSIDNASVSRIVEANYTSATSGFIVWKGVDGNYGRWLEFIIPPSYTRKEVSREHAGSYVEMAYQYWEIDRNNVRRTKSWVDRCNLFDKNDESFMGWAPETEGPIGVYPLNDKNWLEDPNHGMKYSDGSPTDKLYAIFQDVDRSAPTSWGG